MDHILERYQKLPLGNICDANEKKGAMDPGIAPITGSVHMAGYAYTVKGSGGDNLALHHAMLHAGDNDVLVADMGGYQNAGHFGEIMARACMKKGIAGLVIDGAVRDKQDLIDLKFPVFSRGVCPNGTIKVNEGTLDEVIRCGGIEVSPGDLIVGSIDGVVVIPKDKIVSVLERAEAIAEKEDRITQQILEGKTTAEIYHFPIK